MKLKNENKLADVDLEQVVGGGQLDQDSRFLNVLLRGREGQCGRYGSWTVKKHRDEIVRAWASVGVEFSDTVTPYGGPHACKPSKSFHYSINGKEVSQYEAWAHAEQVVGKHLKHSDWDW